MMKAKALTLTLLLPLVTAVPSSSAARRSLESLVPADASVVVLVHDVPRIRASWPQSAFGRTWNDASVKRFFAPFREKAEIDRLDDVVKGKVGYTLTELLDCFDGSAALVTFVDLRSEGEPRVRAGLVAAIAEGRRDVVLGWLSRDATSRPDGADKALRFEETTEEFEGETLHVRRQVGDGGPKEMAVWAVVDGYLVIGEPKSHVQELVASVKKGSVAAPLAADEGFRKVADKTVDADVLFYLNLKSFAPFVMEGLRKSMKDGAAQAMGVTPEVVFQALGLDALQALYLGTRVAPDATHLDAGITYTSDKGLIKAFAYRPGPVRLPDFIPEDVVGASSSSFSFAGFWDGLKGTLQAMNPMAAGLIQMQLQELKEKSGIDLEGRLLPSLGDWLITANFQRTQAEPGARSSPTDLATLYGLAVTDRQVLELSLEALKKLAGGGAELFETQRYLDDTIYLFKSKLPAPNPGSSALSFAYALTDDFLFLSNGGTDPIKAVLSRRRQPGRSLWSRADVKQAIAALPEGASEVGHSNAATLFALFFQGMAAAQTVASGEGNPAEQAKGKSEPFCDPEAMPDVRALEGQLGPVVSGTYKDRQGFFTTLRFLPPRP